MADGYEISFDPARMQFDVILGFLHRSYWSPRIRPEVVRQAMANSLLGGVYDLKTGQQVAYARVVTDYATFAWLCDVFVDEAHRRKGLAKDLIQALIDHPSMGTIRRWALATRDAQSLYEELGFEVVPEGRWMHLVLPASNWQLPEPDVDGRFVDGDD